MSAPAFRISQDAVAKAIEKGVDLAFPYFDPERAVLHGAREAILELAGRDGFSLHEAVAEGVAAGIVEAAKQGYLTLGPIDG